jgi:two-component system, OmpR family, alkaline phosphatase synthesis response regulator PhoP
MARKRILLIEDEFDMVYALVIQLEAVGYEVLVARDGQTGLDVARKEKPDLIILDLMLPKVDGFKICRMLKFDKRYMKIPIIIFTAKIQDQDKQLGKEVGADAYITKPFDAQVLLDKICALLE